MTNLQCVRQTDERRTDNRGDDQAAELRFEISKSFALHHTLYIPQLQQQSFDMDRPQRNLIQSNSFCAPSLITDPELTTGPCVASPSAITPQ
jgi:hypothetical protein